MKTAFCTYCGVYEYVLTNDVANLQRVVEGALGDLLGKVCFLQLDEIIVCSKSLTDHKKDYSSLRDSTAREE